MIPQVCQKNLTCEDFGNELCHRRHIRSVANNPAECRELRCDVFTSLIRGYTDSRVTSDIPKIRRLPLKHARGGAKEDAATRARVQGSPATGRTPPGTRARVLRKARRGPCFLP